VRAAVAQLPHDQRRAIELAYFDGLTHREIAERDGLPLGTVKGRLRLGLQRLYTSLAEPAPGIAQGTRHGA
jgi:RNA polymerase sigma-70 factor (ECF subfamily)